MSFLLKSERYEKKRVDFIKITAIVFCLIVIIQIIFPKLFPSFFLRVVSPIWSVRDRDDRDQTISELKAEIESMTLLSKDISENKPANTITARVLSLPPASFYDTLIINIGKDHGVVEKKKVYVGNMISIGEVAEVYENTSKVVLYSSPNQPYDVLVGTSSIKVTAYGKGAGVYEAEVPREAGIAVGDIVTVPAISHAIYGKVETVVTDPSRTFASIFFKSPVSIQSLTKVYVEQ